MGLRDWHGTPEGLFCKGTTSGDQRHQAQRQQTDQLMSSPEQDEELTHAHIWASHSVLQPLEQACSTCHKNAMLTDP